MNLGLFQGPRSWGTQTPLLECPFFGLSLMGPLASGAAFIIYSPECQSLAGPVLEAGFGEEKEG